MHLCEPAAAADNHRLIVLLRYKRLCDVGQSVAGEDFYYSSVHKNRDALATADKGRRSPDAIDNQLFCSRIINDLRPANFSFETLCRARRKFRAEFNRFAAKGIQYAALIRTVPQRSQLRHWGS